MGELRVHLCDKAGHHHSVHIGPRDQDAVDDVRRRQSQGHAPTLGHQADQRNYIRVLTSSQAAYAQLSRAEVNMGLTTRRSFLKTTMAAGAIASTGIAPLVAAVKRTATDTVVLGHSKMKVTRLAFRASA